VAVSRVQIASGSYDQASGAPTSVSATWGTATTAGNTLVAVVGISLVSGGSSTYSAPAAWGTSVARVDNALNVGCEIWVIPNASSRSGSETFSISGVARDSTLQLIELSPCTLDTTGADATGSSVNPSTGAVAPTASLSIYRLAALFNRNNSTQSAPTNSFTEFSEIMSPNATAGNRVNSCLCEKIETSSASTSCTTTLGTSRPWAAVQLIFKETSSAVTVAADAGTVTLAGQTPSLAGTGTATTAAGVGALTLAGQTPTLAGTGSASVAASPASVTVTGVTPTLSGSGTASLTANPGALALAGATPTLAGTGTATLAAPVGVLTLTGVTPDLSTPTTDVNPVALTVREYGHSATVTAERTHATVHSSTSATVREQTATTAHEQS
jgi:hypothetical protein